MIGYLYHVRFFKQFKYVAVDMYAIVADALIRDISGMFEHVAKKFSKIIKAAIRLKMQWFHSCYKNTSYCNFMQNL